MFSLLLFSHESLKQSTHRLTASRAGHLVIKGLIQSQTPSDQGSFSKTPTPKSLLKVSPVLGMLACCHQFECVVGGKKGKNWKEL